MEKCLLPPTPHQPAINQNRRHKRKWYTWAVSTVENLSTEDTRVNPKVSIKTKRIKDHKPKERDRRLKQLLNRFAPNLTILLQDITSQSQMASFQVQLPHPTSQSHFFCPCKRRKLRIPHPFWNPHFTTFLLYQLESGLLSKASFHCFCECYVALMNHKWLKLGSVDTKYKDRSSPALIRKGYYS